MNDIQNSLSKNNDLPKTDHQPQAVLLYGRSGSGKTIQALRCCTQAEDYGWNVGGILAPGTFQNNMRYDFDVMDILSGQKIKLCTSNPLLNVQNNPIKIGRFIFYEEAFQFGNTAIEKAISNKVDLLIIDEIGPLECTGNGWASALKKATSCKIPKILITVRTQLIQTIAQNFFPNYFCSSFAVEETEKLLEYWNLL